VVSHDRDFLNNVVSAALIFESDFTVNEYIGGYDDWKQQLAKRTGAVLPEPAVQPPKTASPAPEKVIKKLSYKETQALNALPGLIDALEKEQEALHQQLADFEKCRQPGFVANTESRLKTIETELDEAYVHWEALDSRTHPSK